MLHHGSFGEAKWLPAEMPLSYDTAPTLVNNCGFSDIPNLLDMISGVHRGSPVAPGGEVIGADALQLPFLRRKEQGR
jgi:hypothetical protein